MSSTWECARMRCAEDARVRAGRGSYGEKLHDPDEGFTPADVKDPQKAEAVYKVIRERLDKYRKERPGGYLVREAPAADLKQLNILAGHPKGRQLVTKFRKNFTNAEIDDH